jgi:putative Mn2+ efflux pump MntP
MDIVSLILIAIGLSFDTFAVSVSTGIKKTSLKFSHALKIALTFGIFHVVMPLIGWFLGVQIELYISNYDHWIAFGLLTILGVKMIYESFTKEEIITSINPLKPTLLIGMAIATSIDALVVGVSFAFMNINIYLSIAVIGFITFLMSMAGMLFGKKVGGILGKKMEIVGGLILIIIGLKTLLSHLL